MNLKEMQNKYHTIYADPPWNESGGGKIKRGADKHYPLMKTKEIIQMAPFIQHISKPNAHCYLWVTNNFLPDGLKVLDAWGFRYVTQITWFKDGNIGLGQYFRGVTESCLFGVKGMLDYKVVDGKRQQGLTGFHEPKGKHSAKPVKMRNMIEKVSYPPFVEIFARPRNEDDDIFYENPAGWDFVGNQVDGTDIRTIKC
jgi:N6-adenosine-specific RNA methylase IME4